MWRELCGIACLVILRAGLRILSGALVRRLARSNVRRLRYRELVIEWSATPGERLPCDGGKLSVSLPVLTLGGRRNASNGTGSPESSAPPKSE